MKHMKKARWLFFLVFVMIFFSFCTGEQNPKNEVEGIIIPTTLFHLTKYENTVLTSHISESLQGNIPAFSKLIFFDCGGASGVYDLGAVIIQVFSKLGEAKSTNLIQALNQKEKLQLLILLQVGLEYSSLGTEAGRDFAKKVIKEWGERNQK
jgi:hypothetical protein